MARDMPALSRRGVMRRKAMLYLSLRRFTGIGPLAQVSAFDHAPADSSVAIWEHHGTGLGGDEHADRCHQRHAWARQQRAGGGADARVARCSSGVALR